MNEELKEEIQLRFDGIVGNSSNLEQFQITCEDEIDERNLSEEDMFEYHILIEDHIEIFFEKNGIKKQ